MPESDTPPEPAQEPAPEPAASPKTSPKTSRTWPQRLTIAAVFAMAIGTFAAAGGLYAGQRVIEDRNIAPELVTPLPTTVAPQPDDDTTIEDTVADPTEPVETAPPATFPPAEPNAKNFLITGADNNACVDPDSPYAPAFGDRSNFGERSDTIMMWRVNPSTSQVAVLSFPRDLFVDIANSSRRGRINEAYERDNANPLNETIFQNFGIAADHFIQVDFCAFQELVNAVDGVAVPFDTPVRDPNTGLNVTEAGCFTFTGDHALAYVRSRYLEYQDEDGDWRRDGTSDLGRISRQQDFLRRTVQQLLSAGAYNPDVAGGLIEVVSEYITTDPELTPRKMLEFAGVLRDVDPTEITTYQIEATPTTIQGNAVLVPSVRGDNMQAILSVFRGQATLEDIPDQVFATTVPPITDPPSPSVGGDSSVTPGDDAEPTITLPSVIAEENQFGVVPDKSISC